MILDIETLNNTGDELFEKIIKTLLMQVIGPGVTPFSKGQDGAREAIFNGSAAYPSIIENWTGSWIFQVKHSNIANGISDARQSIKYLINAELLKLEKYGFINSGSCDNYIYITNVPFTGKAKTGMHDYILEKKKEYKVGNFDYWDGEKVLALLNKYPAIRETFFPTKGFSEIDPEELKTNQELFVEPVQYNKLKEMLLQDKILNIVGPPHVGKTSLAKYLGNEILKTKGLNKLWQVDIIDHIETIPKTENCIIIFDDLYGDINYENIGKKTKILNRLSENNYVIITSRDYIFKSAEINSETIEKNSKTELILQEGSYTNAMLISILEKHSKRKFESNGLSPNTYKLILNHKQHITQYLRFPHNLQMFVQLCDNNIQYNKDIEKVINAAKHIENAIKKYVKNLPILTQKNLLIAALGKIQNLDEILKICKFCWNVAENDTLIDFEKHSSILNIQENTIKFVHPSYKTAVVNAFREYNKKLLNETILKITFDSHFIETKMTYQTLINDAITDLSSSEITKILETKELAAKMITNIWVILIRRNYSEAFNILKKIIKTSLNKNAGSVFPVTFLSAKDSLKSKETMELIEFLLSLRNKVKYDKLRDHLIAHLCYKVKSKSSHILRKVRVNSLNDLKLRINILGALGTLHPSKVYDELLQLSAHENLGVRVASYKAVMILSGKHYEMATKALLTFEENEVNISSKLWLNRINTTRQTDKNRKNNIN